MNFNDDSTNVNDYFGTSFTDFFGNRIVMDDREN